MQFQVDYDGAHQNWGKIRLDTNNSSVRTNMEFYVKSTSGAEQVALTLEGQPSAVPNAIFAGNVSIGDALFYVGAGNDFSISHDGTHTYVQNNTGTLHLMQNVDDGDILFMSDDGSGGTAEYFRLDGSAGRNVASKEINHIDNVYATFGTGRDLRLIHDGSNSFFESYNHNLYIDQNFDDGDIVFRNDNGSGGKTTYLTIDGGDEEVVFSKRAKFIDNARLNIGSSRDLQIYHDGSNSYINEVGTGSLIVQASDLF